MNKPLDLPLEFVDPDDLINNTSSNTSFAEVLDAGMSRRSILRGAGGVVAALASGVSLSACGGGDDDPVAPAPAASTGPVSKLGGFTPVSRSIADRVTVPEGYTATVVFATGDPIAAGVAAYKNDGTDTGYDQRSGDCHDGMEYFGLSAAGAPDQASSSRGLLGINHEYITPVYLHPTGPTLTAPRPAGQVDIEVDCHGVSVVEIAKGSNGRFATVQASTFNRRVTALTEIEISGPARGNGLLVTKFSPTGTKTRGTLNNCGTGKTPWGTLLTGEENWAGYFFRAIGDQALRTAKANVALTRYGRTSTATTAAASRYGWETAGAADKYARWNTSVIGATAADDYRNEINAQGYMVEIDPYSKTALIKKRTAMGRFAHESAAYATPVVGQPIVVYMGDDAQNEYIYKYVSTAVWSAADANAADRIAVGDKYLDSGKLYAAKFNNDGTGSWTELSITTPAITAYATYAFADQADVSVHSRIAGDAVGATKMDRPEWCGVAPTTGEVYFTLTNNSSRRVAPTGTQTAVDAANPRAYSDIFGVSTVQNGNVNGHIVRIRDGGATQSATALTFTWDVFLFGAESGASPTLVNLSGLNDTNDFSSPDGLVFSPSTGICWIQTDDGAYVDTTNCMMLAAVPGAVGDGILTTLNYGTATVNTYKGKAPTADTLKRFLVGPRDQEITGYCETPDGTVVFINIQHPGDGTLAANLANGALYTSNWPGNAGYGAGGATARARSATVMITKNDGGRIGT